MTRLSNLTIVAIVLLQLTLSHATKTKTNCHVEDSTPQSSHANEIAQLEYGRSSGCGRSPIVSGTYNVTVNDTERHYIVRVPTDYDPTQAYGFLIAFHWLGGTMEDVASKYLFYGMQLFHNESTILVAPQGVENKWKNDGGQDIEFVRQILSSVDAGLCVNQNQRFAMGFSYGASMTHSVACALGDKFRAVSVLSGGEYSGCERKGGGSPVAYMATHGTRDTVVPIDKGRAIRDVFVKANGCTPQTPVEPQQGDLNHITTEYQGCSTGHPVVWTAFDDGHTAMASDGSLMQNSTATTWQPAATWNFFSQFS